MYKRCKKIIFLLLVCWSSARYSETDEKVTLQIDKIFPNKSKQNVSTSYQPYNPITLDL
jgi:hypothetical protein